MLLSKSNYYLYKVKPYTSPLFIKKMRLSEKDLLLIFWMNCFYLQKDEYGEFVMDCIELDGVRYGRLEYSHVQEEFGWSRNTTVVSIQRVSGRTGLLVKCPPFLTHRVFRGKKGSDFYFTPNPPFNEKIFPNPADYQLLNPDKKYSSKRLKEKPMEKLIDTPKDVARVEEFNSDIQDIIKSLLTLKVSPEKPLFTTRVNYADPTLSLRNIKTYLTELYNGSFFVNNGNSISKKYKDDYFIDYDVIKLFEDVKGDWKAIKKLVLKCARFYSLWHDKEYMPSNKKHVLKSIDQWMLNTRGESSHMLACTEEPRKPKEIRTDAVYNSLPRTLQKLADKFIIPSWDSDSFIFIFKKIYVFYINAKEELGSDYKVGTHFLTRPETFITEYFEWISSLKSPILVVNFITPKGELFKRYLVERCQRHDFSESVYNKLVRIAKKIA